MNILVTFKQTPYNGGSATNAYKLISYLRKHNINTCGVSFTCMAYHDKDKTMDPDNIGGMFKCRYNKQKVVYSQKEINKVRNNVYNYLKAYPDIILAWNYLIPIMSKSLFKYSQVFYIACGSPIFTIGASSPVANKISVEKFIKDKTKYDYTDSIYYDLEKQSMSAADYIVPVSNIVTKILKSAYEKTNKLLTHVDFSHVLFNDSNDENKNNSQIFDLVVISSNWDRIVKNKDLAVKIYKEFPLQKKIIIGKNNDDFKDIRNTFVYDNLDNKVVNSILNQSKLLLVTSFFESCSLVSREALHNGCNILISKNVGFSEDIDDKFVCDDVYDINEWKTKINNILKNNYELPKFKQNNIIKYFSSFVQPKINVLIACGDITNIGGAATNSYNLLKLLKTKRNFNGVGLFISKLNPKDYTLDPDDIKNIHHINLDEDIETNVTKFKENFNDQKLFFDIIFCKNYKIFVILKKVFPYTKIIFSPSGLRYLTSVITEKKDWYNVIKKHPSIIRSKNKYELIKHDNLFRFIKKNDRYLDDTALHGADFVLPNSLLSHSIIKRFGNINNNLLEPLYLSNIVEIAKNDISFKDRKYDLGFVAHSWKRQCKNYDFVLELINNDKLKDLSIVIVGGNQRKEEYKHNSLVVFDNLNKTDVLDIFRNTKTIIVPSKYDSNPNVLVEAVYSRCNVVTSTNVGNSEYLNKRLVIKDELSMNEWIDKIRESTKELILYEGPSKEDVENEFLQLLSFVVNVN